MATPRSLQTLLAAVKRNDTHFSAFLTQLETLVDLGLQEAVAALVVGRCILLELQLLVEFDLLCNM